jgi:O-antigen ligase
MAVLAPLAVVIGVLVAVAVQANLKLVLAAIAALAVTAVLLLCDLAVSLVVFTVLTFFEQLPSFGPDITLIKVAGALVALSWAVRVLDDQERLPLFARDEPLIAFAIAGFFVLAAASAIWATDSSATTSAVGRLALVIILLFVTYSAIREPRHLRWMMWAFCVGAALTTGYGLLHGLTSGGDRLAGGILDPNFLAASILVGVVFAVFLLSATSSRLQRLLLFALLGLLVPSFFLTQSRGAFVAFAVTVVVSLFIAGPARGGIVVLLLIVGAFAIGYFTFVATPAQRERLTNISAQGSSGRADDWHIALSMASGHPLLGIGLNNYRVVEPDYITQTTPFLDVYELLRIPQTHNTYLQTLSELGAVGLALLGGILGSILWMGLRGARALARAGRRVDEAMVRGVLVGAFALMTAYFFLPGLYDKQLWLLLGLTAAAGSIGSRTAAED